MKRQTMRYLVGAFAATIVSFALAGEPTPAVETMPQTAPAQGAHTTKMDQEERVADATWALVWVTGVLAGFTAALFGVTYMLARDAKGTAARQAQETIDALAISRKSADAAHRMV